MTEGMELPNQEKVRMLGEKETYKYLGIFKADIIKQVEMKNYKRISQENEKATRNQTILQEPNKRDKYLGCPPGKIFESILEVNQRRT